MAKRKPELLVRGVLLRDVAALKRRVQALEKAVWPSTTLHTRRNARAARVIAVDAATARRAAIEAFYKGGRDEWLRGDSRRGKQHSDRERLNQYLRELGFAPEPED